MKKRTVLLVSISLLLIIVIAGSYAYLRTAATQTGTNTVTSLACLNVSVTNANGSSPINLTNAFAIPDSEGLETTPYNFTVTNNCTTSVSVDINLESLEVANSLSKEYIKVAMDGINILRPIAFLLSSYPETDATIANATSNKLTNIILTSGESQSYSLRLWIDSATTAEQGMNKSYEGKIVAVASPTLKYKPNVNLRSAEEGTLLAAIRDGAYSFKAPITIPGREISTSTEAIISSTPDDYGTSYYFRGNVTNNFVIFANMCWRIVRITGNGAIKLVLFNKSASNCGTANPSLGTLTLTSGKNAYIGYMYGTPGSDSYAAEHENITSSSILNMIIPWYNSSFSNTQQDLMADVIWCNDKSIYSGTGFNNGSTNYGGYSRLKTPSTANPTLVCPNDALGGKLSKFTAQENQFGNAALHNAAETEFYKIGLVTADEAVFAGAVFGVNNTTFYLVKGTYFFRLLTPWTFGNPLAHISNNGALGAANSAYAIRPSIALTPEVEFALNGTGAPGTSTNPYVIVESNS